MTSNVKLRRQSYADWRTSRRRFCSTRSSRSSWGQQPEANLLDMIVLVALGRIIAEEHWVPNVIGESAGQPLLRALRKGETDIWNVAAKVLDVNQRAAFHAVIRDWRNRNPSVTLVYYVRFSDFAAELGPSAVEEVRRIDGLLPEVAEATRSVDEIRRLAERALLFAQQAPALASLEVEKVLYDFAAQPETQALLSGSRSFALLADTLSQTLDDLPALVAAERSAAINQTLVGISAERERTIKQAMRSLALERESLLRELDTRHGQLSALLGDLKGTLAVGSELAAHVSDTMTTVDTLVQRLDLGAPAEDTEPIHIADYQETLRELTTTVQEVNQLVQSVDRLVAVTADEKEPIPIVRIFRAINTDVQGLIVLTFALITALAVFVIVGTVAAMLFYRRAARVTK